MVYTGMGPTHGPAPSSNTEKGPVLSCTVTDGEHEWRMTLQFWNHVDGSGIYLAWEIDGAPFEWNEASGYVGVFERSDASDWSWSRRTNRLWFGTEVPEHDGTRFLGVRFPDEGGTPAEAAYFDPVTWMQSPVLVASEFRWRPEERLAPVDAERGRTFELDLADYDRERTIRSQFWRRESTNAVYVAWEDDDETSMYGTFSGRTAHLGGMQATAPRGFYGWVARDEEVATALRAEYQSLQGAAEGPLLSVVGDVTEVEPPDEVER